MCIQPWEMMTQSIDMTSIYIADYVGVVLLGLILLARGWELPGRRGESRILLVMIIATMIDCLIDPFIFAVDGRPGVLSRALIVFGNSALFLYNLVVGMGMLALIAKHINKKISRAMYVTVWVLTGLETMILIINLFIPVAFYVDENNVYSRGPFYFVYIVVAFYLLVYALALYLTARLRDASLRYFPVWEFVIPIVLGVTLQTLFYGISAQPVSFAVAFCSIVICLQKEYLYVDKLTGVYNRYELDKIVRHYVRHRKKKFAAFMLDMNGFKAINDDYSHNEGDDALRNMANILVGVIGTDGNVIRYAGDEFVIIMDVLDDDTIGEYSSRISEAIDSYNAGSGKPYKLSSSIGGAVFDTDNVDEVIGHIDKLMYDDKIEYYMDHDRRGVKRDGSF